MAFIEQVTHPHIVRVEGIANDLNSILRALMHNNASVIKVAFGS